MVVGRRGGRHVGEIDSLDDLTTLLDSGASLRGVRLQDLDLSQASAALRRRPDLRGLVVLGGHVPHGLGDHLARHGALVFPADPDAPVNIYRAHLYQPQELYAGLDGGYDATPDAAAYHWATDRAVAADVYTTLLRAIHDDSVADALDELLDGRRVVGVMGGHAVQRGDAAYAVTARLGHDLARAGLVVTTGGGPGAMEAANLGAFARADADLEAAVRQLATVPSYAPDVATWAALGLQVRADLVAAGAAGASNGTGEAPAVRSVGIPTWFYGHEPPNVFCDGIAKFFSNALREEGLLARSNVGIVVMPGAAGTAQEIFQAVTPLYYAAEGAALPRLVLVGHRHWTVEVPVWPAVQALAAGRAMAPAVHLVDDIADASALLT